MAASARPISIGTLVTASGQTELTFTSIPSWVKRITIGLNGLSADGGTTILVQLGDSGGYEVTGYTGRVLSGSTSPSIGPATSTAGFPLINSNADAYLHTGHVLLTLIDVSTNTWVCSGALTVSANIMSVLSGGKSLSATLDRLRLYIDGTQTFDGGTVNILFE